MKKTLLTLSIFAFFFTYTSMVFIDEVRSLTATYLMHKENPTQVLFKALRDTVPSNKKESNHRHQLDLLQGKWVHVKDTLAIVTIDNNIWTFDYEYEDPNEREVDEHLIKLVDTIYLHNQKIGGKYLLLIQENDTLKYTLDYLTDKEMSLFWLPAGRFHDYKKVEQ